jgi:hypothetical protein
MADDRPSQTHHRKYQSALKDNETSKDHPRTRQMLRLIQLPILVRVVHISWRFKYVPKQWAVYDEANR